MKQFLIMLFFMNAFYSMAQIKPDPELERRLDGKDKFYDIKATVAGYYQDKLAQLQPGDSAGKKKINRMRKMWNRYLFDAESHLDADGKIVNAAQRNMAQLSVNGTLRTELTETAYGSWAFAGPTYVEEGIGRVNRIAFDPSSAATIYAGSSGGGLFRTTNSGISWSNVASFLPSLGISGIVLTSSNTIYILTGDGDSHSSGGLTVKYGYIRYSVGVLKSTDGGSTWQRTAPFPGLDDNDHYSGMKLVRDPNNVNILLAATTSGLFRTTDGGGSWTRCTIQAPGNSVMVYDVEFAPGRSDIVYCSVRYDNDSEDGRFLRSANGGVLFSPSNAITYSPNVFAGAQRISIAVTPDNPNVVYLLAGPGSPSGNSSKGVWYSSDLGVNFTRRSTSPNVLGAPDQPGYQDQNLYDMALAVSPTNVNVVVAGGLVIFQSTSGGVLFGQETPYHGSGSIHPDVHELIYNPANGYLYAGTDGGVSVSTNNGASWSKLFTGLSCTQFYHFGVQDDGGDIWGGTQDNGILIKNGTASSFDQYAGGDGYDVLTDMAPAGNQDDKYYSVNEKVYADATIDEEITPPGASEFFANLAMSPTNEDVIYAGYEELYVSYSRGDNWADIGSPKVPGNWCVSSCPTNRKRVYAAGTRSGANFATGLFRVDNLDDVIPDAVTDLTAALESAGYPGNNPKITDIAVSTNTSARLWITVGGYQSPKVFYSNNSGVNWTNITGTLSSLPANCIFADDNDNVYVGTDVGVYYRGAGDADWTPFYNGLPRVAVSEIEILNLAFGTDFLYASTYGRGIWASEVFSACPGTLDINSTQIGQKFYQASNTITTDATISGGTGTDVHFKAGTSVTMQPGFIVNPGTEFTAYIGACNTGVPLRTARGDSNVVVIKNIKAAREYGFVDDAVTDGQNITLTLKIFNGGSYTIRLYDVDGGVYISSLPASLISGMNTINIQAQTEKGKNYRADLFKDDMLVHLMDVRSN